MTGGSPPPLDAESLLKGAKYELAVNHSSPNALGLARGVLALLARVDDLERERAEADGDWAEIGATQAARAEAAEAALEAAERERDANKVALAAANHTLGRRAEAAEARLREVHIELEKSRSELLAAQQALRELLGVQPAIPVTADRWRAAVENANLALAAIPLESTSEKSVGRVPAQEDKP